MEAISEPSKWREYIKNNEHFNQEIPFDFEKVYFKLQKASEDPEKLNPFYTISAIYDFTKIFKHISTALSMGFSDITEKSEIMRERFAEFPKAEYIQDLLVKEIALKGDIIKLNGDNNKQIGYKQGKYSKYISATRTFLRLLWFLEYLIDIFISITKEEGKNPVKTILGNSYNKVLAPHHPFITRKAVALALMFSSAGNVANSVKLIFGYKDYNDEAKEKILDTINLMKIIWKGGHQFYEENDLLGLP